MASAAVIAQLLGLTGPGRIVGRRTRPTTWSKPHQGAQEIARRQRQIGRGQLTVSNGLVR
jgi:hypothetical protein